MKVQMIEIKNLNKSYKSKSILKDINLTVPSSGVFALLGLNGAGKTTLISILCGISKFDSGEVLYDGNDYFKILNKNKSFCSLTPQDFAFYPTLSVKENLNFFSKINDFSRDKQKDMIDFVIDVNKLENFLHVRANNLSGGLKRRLNLAIGLLNDPKILFLDEPTVGIDPQSRTFILNAIKELSNNNKLIFYTSHYMQEVDFLANHIAIIDNGMILSSFKKDISKSVLILESQNSFSQDEIDTLNSFAKFSKISNYMQSNDFTYTKFLDFIIFAKQHNFDFSKISFSPLSSESIFLSLTGESIRDE